MYADPEFAVLSTWLRDVLDRLAPSADEKQLTQIFQASSRYEYLFWRWPTKCRTGRYKRGMLGYAFG